MHLHLTFKSCGIGLCCSVQTSSCLGGVMVNVFHRFFALYNPLSSPLLTDPKAAISDPSLNLHVTEGIGLPSLVTQTRLLFFPSSTRPDDSSVTSTLVALTEVAT